MRKILVALFSFALLLGMSSVSIAQTSDTSSKPDKKVAKAEKKEAKAAAKGKSLALTGWVKTEEGKTVFVNDKDKQTWAVSNADVLKPHDGMHVKVKATPNESDKSLTIDSVKNLRSSKQAGEKKAEKKEAAEKK